MTPPNKPLAERLRECARDIRRKPTPLADVIPLLTEAADEIECHESDRATPGLQDTCEGCGMPRIICRCRC